METATPVRLRRSRAKGARLVSPNGLPIRCVDRTSVFGNIFRAGEFGLDKAAAVHLYLLMLDEDWMLLRIELERMYPFPEVLAYRLQEAMKTREKIIRNIDKLRNANLACYCPLAAPGEVDICHAAVLMDWVKRMESART